MGQEMPMEHLAYAEEGGRLDSEAYEGWSRLTACLQFNRHKAKRQCTLLSLHARIDLCVRERWSLHEQRGLCLTDVQPKPLRPLTYLPPGCFDSLSPLTCTSIGPMLLPS